MNLMYSFHYEDKARFAQIVGIRNEQGKMIQTVVPEEQIVSVFNPNALADVVMEELYNAWFKLIGTVLVIYEGEMYDVPISKHMQPREGFIQLQLIGGVYTCPEAQRVQTVPTASQRTGTTTTSTRGNGASPTIWWLSGS